MTSRHCQSKNLHMENLFTLSALTIATIPVTTGLVSVLKTSLNLPSKYNPLASLAIGIACVALIGGAWQSIIAQGILVGLAASGLYSGGKAVIAPSTSVLSDTPSEVIG